MKKGHKNWLPFEQARAYVRKLNIKTQRDWRAYCQSGKKPKNIPICAHTIYKNDGWQGYADWLGSDYIPNQERKYRSFEDARAFVNTLNLKNYIEWHKYCQSGKKPADIPYSAYHIYKHSGWLGISDWLGNGHLTYNRKNFLTFEEVRTFVRTLNIKDSKQWNAYCKSGKKPNNIPADPSQKYSDKGWSGFRDWLGTGKNETRTRDYLPFEKAKEYVLTLKIKNYKAWKKYCKSGLKPNNIPSNPNSIYKDKGWSGLGDWLGTGKIATNARDYFPFEMAKEYVFTLKIKDLNGWRKYCTSGLKPDNIPSSPSVVYKDKGWSTLEDWLGTGKISPRNREMLPFEKAKEFVRTLKIKNYEGWKKYCKSGLKPNNIPANPNSIYKDKGWSGIKDWLGTKN